VTVDAENKYIVTGDITIIATFVQQYTVTVVNGDETQDVDAGEEITIVADEPEDGYEFLGWKKNDATEYISTDTSYTFEVAESATYTAVFAAIEGDDLASSATVVSTDAAQAYNVRTTDKDGNDTVALKITAEAGCGYPNVVLDIGDFDMMMQTLAFNIKVVSGHPWYSIKYLDADKATIGGEVGGDITANTWVTVSRDEKVANAKYIKFIFNAENPAKGDIEVYIDAMALTNRPTIHPDAVTYSGSSYYFPTYKLMAADWAGKAVTFEFYMEEGTFRFNMNDGDHGWKQWASDIVFTRTGDAVTTTAGAVVSTENAGWYKFIINTSTFATPEGADAFSMIAHSAAYTTSVFKVDPTTIEIIDEVYHINTKTYAGERIYFAECGVASIMSSDFADKAFTFEFTMKEGSCYIDIVDLDHGWAQWLGGVTFTRSGDTVTVSDKKGKVESVGNGWYKYSVNTYYFADLASPADRISGFACSDGAKTLEFTVDLDTIKLEEQY
ncbi:MAG: hypothetical protein MJ193_03785, partial [Clostridia bacterium]|nr:hypothetical protein [Clostridia bacterium]